MFDAVVAAAPQAPVTLITFPGDHVTPVPGGYPAIVQWLAGHVRGAPPTAIDAITDTSTTLWWTQLTQQGTAARWTTVRGAEAAAGSVTLHLVDSMGLDAAVDVASLGLPQTRYVVEDLAVDQATFNAQAVDLVNGRALYQPGAGLAPGDGLPRPGAAAHGHPDAARGGQRLQRHAGYLHRPLEPHHRLRRRGPGALALHPTCATG